jgi:hypothetical protein
MSKIERMRASLSETAIEALASTGHAHRGGTPRGHSITPEVLAEFRIRGVVGRSDGFSEIGAMLAGKLNAEKMDAMF